jgi:hypothetical protein
VMKLMVMVKAAVMKLVVMVKSSDEVDGDG